MYIPLQEIKAFLRMLLPLFEADSTITFAVDAVIQPTGGFEVMYIDHHKPANTSFGMAGVLIEPVIKSKMQFVSTSYLQAKWLTHLHILPDYPRCCSKRPQTRRW
jgi:hypothetical protein